MNAAELDDTIRKLRVFAVTYGMQWVLDEVDDALSLGIPEVRTLRQSRRRGRTTYEDVTLSDSLYRLDDAGDGAPSAMPTTKRAEQFVHPRPMTRIEEAVLLVEALRNVLVSLDDIADETLSALNPYSSLAADEASGRVDLSSRNMPTVQSILYAPDEGISSPAIDISILRHAERRSRVADVLDGIEVAINS